MRVPRQLACLVVLLGLMGTSSGSVFAAPAVASSGCSITTWVQSVGTFNGRAQAAWVTYGPNCQQSDPGGNWVTLQEQIGYNSWYHVIPYDYQFPGSSGNRYATDGYVVYGVGGHFRSVAYINNQLVYSRSYYCPTTPAECY
jgi:endo-beta-N-acetylglucosaminidase D